MQLVIIFYTTKENPDTEIVVGLKECKRPKQTKIYKSLERRFNEEDDLYSFGWEKVR